MQDAEALRILSAISQPTRWRTVVLLARTGDSGMASSDIADAIGVPRNLMSSHLAVLSRAGVVSSIRNGRTVSYVVEREAVIGVGEYLTTMAV